MVIEKNIKDGVLKFTEHLNNTMDKPDGYSYELKCYLTEVVLSIVS